MRNKKLIPASLLAKLSESIRAQSLGREHLIDSPRFEIRETGSIVEAVFVSHAYGPRARLFWGVATFLFVVVFVVLCDRFGAPTEMLVIGVLNAICAPPLIVFGLWCVDEHHKHLVAAGPYFRINRAERTIELPRSGGVYSFDEVVEVILAGKQFTVGPANQRASRWSEQIGLRIRVEGGEDRIVHVMFNPMLWGKGRKVASKIADAIAAPLLTLPPTREELAKRPWFRAGASPKRTETWEDGSPEQWWREIENGESPRKR